MGRIVRLWVLSSALVETMLFSGCLLGWNSLSPILTDLGVLSDGCYSDPGLSVLWGNDTDTPSNHSDDELPSLADIQPEPRGPPGPCTSQKQSLNLGFTVGSFFLWGTFLPLQLLMGYAQIRTLRQIGGALTSVSCLMLAYCCTNPHNLSLFLPFALVAQGVGGCCVLFSSLMLPHIMADVGTLYPVLVLAGFSASAAVFTIIKVIYNAGVPFVPIILGYGAISCAMFLNSFLSWSQEKNKNDEENMYRIRLQVNCFEAMHRKPQETEWCQKSLKNKFHKSLRDRERIHSLRRTLSFKRPEAVQVAPPLQDSLLSPAFLLHLVGDSLLLTWTYFYISSINVKLQRVTESPREAGLYSSVFGALQMLGLLTAPLTCVLLHSRRSRRNATANTRPGLSKCSIGRLCALYSLRTVLVLSFGITCLVPSLEVQVIEFILHVLVRTSMFFITCTLFLCMFPVTHFGALLGIHTLIASVLTLLQHPVFLLLTDRLQEDPFWIHGVFLALSLGAAAVPLYLTVRERTRRHGTLSRPIHLQWVTRAPVSQQRPQAC